jgi:hypothetical protein
MNANKLLKIMAVDSSYGEPEMVVLFATAIKKTLHILLLVLALTAKLRAGQQIPGTLTSIKLEKLVAQLQAPMT